jgi:polyisoprenoid-binding protein YceI
MQLKRFSFLIVLPLVVCMGSAQFLRAAETLKLDKEASKITFVGSKPEGKHEGGFKSFEITGFTMAEDASKGELELMIQADSLWSDDDKLTNHLKNPDFFNVRKHPKITFKSTNFQKGKEPGTLLIEGKMRMLDKEVEVKIPASVESNEKAITLKAEFKIDRTKWGMTYGEGKIDKDVSIKATLVMSR